MNDTKQLADNILEGLKNTKKHHLNKKKDITKKNSNKIDGLMLSRIEEFIEIGKKGMSLKDRLLDTCMFNNINKLFINNIDENNQDNNIIGYTIDNKNNTIIKFNKTRNQLCIEQYSFPEKNEKSKKNIQLIQNESFNNGDLNNVSENNNDMTFLKRFKDDYHLSEPEINKNHKKVKSNIIMSKQLKKELKTHKNKNTVFLKNYNMKSIILGSKEKKRKNYDKEKDYIIQKEKIKNTRDESKKKDRDNKYKREDENNNISILRQKDKSRSRKQSRISFHFNKGKTVTKKNSDNYNNIKKIDVDKRNDYDSNINTDEIKSNKYKYKNKLVLRDSVKSMDMTPKTSKTKKSKKKNNIKFKSVLFPKKKSLFDPKKKQKQDLNMSHKKQEEKSDYFDSNYLYSDKSSNKNSNSEKNINYKEREREREKGRERIKNKKNKIHSNKKTYKEDSSVSNDDNKESENNDSSNIKENNNIKKVKNTFHNYSHFKVRHTNNICLGTTLNDTNNNFFIKPPKFAVVRPENLISLEFDRAYKRNSSNNCMINNDDDNLNETNIREDNSGRIAQIKKRNKSFFCCL